MLNDQKLKYIALRRAGIEKKQAAINAGYSSKTASQAASRLEKDPDVKAAIEAKEGELIIRDQTVEPKQEDQNTPSPYKVDNNEYSDAKDFLLDMMNDPNVGKAMRQDAAKTLLPYQHKKLGEEGKKASKAKSAEETQQSTGFKPRVVGNK